MSATPWARARELAHAGPAPLAADHAPLADALGATLAAPLRAAVPLPAFDNAAMDGYAVADGGPWQVVGRLLAGHGEAVSLRTGEAAEIATGAPVPPGTRAVLPYELAVRDGDLVAGAIEPGRYVRRVGEDAAKGAELVPAGSVVTPVLLGLAASVGVDTLPVRTRPRVVALVTGDEIIHSGPPGNGRVRDAVGPMLPGVVDHLGGELVLTMPVPDTPASELVGAVRSADADVVVVCGSSSAGPADRLRGVLAGLGARLVVDGVACRPGSPQALADLRDGRWLVGVPGNPYAALVALLTLLGPLLAGLTGRPLPVLPAVPLRGDPRPAAGLTRLVPVRWIGAEVAVLEGPPMRAGRLPAGADLLAAVPADYSGGPVPLVALP